MVNRLSFYDDANEFKLSCHYGLLFSSNAASRDKSRTLKITGWVQPVNDLLFTEKLASLVQDSCQTPIRCQKKDGSVWTMRESLESDERVFTK